MAKVVLGKRPESFKRPVKFPMLDGTTGTIEVTYKYRTRKEFGAFVDSVAEAARAAGEVIVADETKPFSLAEYFEKNSVANADYVLGIAQAWNLDVDFDKEAIEQLGDELPAALSAVMETYRLACVEGRLGN